MYIAKCNYNGTGKIESVEYNSKIYFREDTIKFYLNSKDMKDNILSEARLVDFYIDGSNDEVFAICLCKSGYISRTFGGKDNRLWHIIYKKDNYAVELIYGEV